MAEVSLEDGLLEPHLEDEDAPPSEEELREIFDAFDVAPTDGVLELGEFKAAMTKFNGGVPLADKVPLALESGCNVPY